MFLQVILIPAYDSSSLAFHNVYSENESESRSVFWLFETP